MKERECEVCGTTEDVSFAPNPYQSDINGDDTEVWMCGNCRHESAMDI